MEEYIFEKFKFGRRDTKTPNLKNHWQDIDLSTYRITKPTVICLGGNGTTDAKEANGMAKIVQNMIGDSEDVDIISITYSHSNLFKTGMLSTKEEYEIVQKLFVSLLYDKNGNRLPHKQAVKNFRNITIFAHCFGSRNVWEDCEKILYLELMRKNVDAFDLNELIEQIFVVSYAPSCKKGSTMTFNVKSINDRLFGEEYQNEMLSLNMQKTKFSAYSEIALDTFMLEVHEHPEWIKDIGKHYFKKYKYVLAKSGKTINLFTDKLSFDDSDHEISVISRSETWKASANSTLLGKAVSQSVAFALASSLVNASINNQNPGFVPLDLNNIILDTEYLLQAGLNIGEQIAGKEKSREKNN